MNSFLKLTTLGLAGLALSFVSCSDDNDETTVITEPTVENVFSEGLPASVDGATFTTNEKGQVTKIVDGSDEFTFEYGTFSRATAYTYNVLVTFSNTRYPEEGFEMYLQLNPQGFVKYALQVWDDEEDGTDEWWFEYNEDGQLTHLKRTESEDNFQVTYANGDITKVVQVDEDNDRSEYTFAYTNDEFKSVVVNKGNVMIFDDFFRIDMDEMGIVYYAGLLGKSTKNLPMGFTEKFTDGETGETENQSLSYHWEFNSDNLPTKFWDYSEWDAVNFTWTIK